MLLHIPSLRDDLSIIIHPETRCFFNDRHRPWGGTGLAMFGICSMIAGLLLTQNLDVLPDRSCLPPAIGISKCGEEAAEGAVLSRAQEVQSSICVVSARHPTVCEAMLDSDLWLDSVPTILGSRVFFPWQ